MSARALTTLGLHALHIGHTIDRPLDIFSSLVHGSLHIIEAMSYRHIRMNHIEYFCNTFASYVSMMWMRYQIDRFAYPDEKTKLKRRVVIIVGIQIVGGLLERAW